MSKANDITLRHIAGQTTERTVWQLLSVLTQGTSAQQIQSLIPDSIRLSGDSFKFDSGQQKAHHKSEQQGAYSAPETFTSATVDADAAAVWTLGALAFYALMGMDVLEGRGGVSQTAATDVPYISSSHASHQLGSIIHQCLAYDPSQRPSIATIHDMASTQLSSPITPQRRLTTSSGKTYATSLVKFWPEEMVVVLLVAVLSLVSNTVLAQSSQGISDDDEINSLVERCIKLRQRSNVQQVLREFDGDMEWTMMDEIKIDRKGECSMRDKVDMFGVNDIGFSILKRSGGVTNTGDRLRDGRDPRYNYSFIEITVKAGATVGYDIPGRVGRQSFVIVPYNASAALNVGMTLNGKSISSVAAGNDGIRTINVAESLKADDKLHLTLSNRSASNQSFVIINYNSHGNE